GGGDPRGPAVGGSGERGRGGVLGGRGERWREQGGDGGGGTVCRLGPPRAVLAGPRHRGMAGWDGGGAVWLHPRRVPRGRVRAGAGRAAGVAASADRRAAGGGLWRAGV